MANFASVRTTNLGPRGVRGGYVIGLIRARLVARCVCHERLLRGIPICHGHEQTLPKSHDDVLGSCVSPRRTRNQGAGR